MRKSTGPSAQPPAPAHVRQRRLQVIRAGITGALVGVLVMTGVLRSPVAAASESNSDTARLAGPADLVVEASEGAISVSWTAVPDAKRYQVRWWLEGTGAAAASELTTAQTAVSIPNLSPGTYLVQVGACRGKPLVCTRRPARTKRKVAVREPLAGPATLVVEASEGAISVSWTAVPDAKRYQVRWWLEGTGAAAASELTTAQTAVSIPNLSPGTYLVSVGACRGKPLICTRKPDRTKQKVAVRDRTLKQLTRTFVDGNTSVEAFVSGLPKHHKHRATFMVRSQSMEKDFVSDKHPRVISWGATADTIFAWGTNANSPRYKEVQFIVKETGDWAFGVIDFATTPPTVKRDERCQSCHIGDPPHPLWAEQGWPGSLTTEYKARATQKVEAWHETGDPRLTAIPVWPDDLLHDQMAYEFTDALAMRHGEVLIESEMPDEPAEGVRLAKKLLCESGTYNSKIKKRLPSVLSLFPVRQMPKSMGKAGSGRRNVNPKSALGADYLSGNSSLSHTIGLYLLDYFVEHEERVKAVYDRAENTDGGTFTWKLHYAPGTATALEELQSRVQIAFGLKDGQQLKYRRTTQADRSRDMQSPPVYLIPKVCAALDAE